MKDEISLVSGGFDSKTKDSSQVKRKEYCLYSDIKGQRNKIYHTYGSSGISMVVFGKYQEV